MIRRAVLHRDESGYSIVEVMVAILILMAAILPMFKMFDVSLQTAMRSSDYDRARALAEKQTEIAQSMSFDDLSATFPKCNGAAVSTPDLKANCIDDSGAYDDLRFSVEKSFVSYDPDSTTIELTDHPDDTELVKVVIEVYEAGDDPNNYIFRTVGVIANNG